MNPTFSHELIVEILLRLPVKSLLRLKCVCKAWFSLISDPHFAKSHFDLAAAPTYRILLKSNRGSSILSIDTESSLHSDSAVSNLLIPHPSNAYVNNFRIFGCCRGFIVYDYDDGDLMLWNPSTNFHKHIPYYHVDYMHKILYGFGYDTSTDDYLIVVKAFETNYYDYPDSSMQIWGTRLEFFSLKTDSWNKLEGINFPNFDGFSCFSAGSFLNGAFHWFSLSNNKKHIDAIIAYDLKEKSLSEIPMPHEFTMEVKSKLLGLSLTVIEGWLSLCYNSFNNEMVEIWMMKEYRVESSWTKSIVLSTRDIHGNIFLPLCFTKGGEIIGTTAHEGLAKFNDQGDLLENPRYGKGFRVGGLRCAVTAVYRESLLSLIIDSILKKIINIHSN